MSLIDWTPLWLSLRLATISTLILLLFCTPLAWWLARTRSLLRSPIEAIVTLPIILPPTVLGFYLLTVLGAHGFIGKGWHLLTGQESLAFTFTGLVIGSVIYSIPSVW